MTEFKTSIRPVSDHSLAIYHHVMMTRRGIVSAESLQISLRCVHGSRLI